MVKRKQKHKVVPLRARRSLKVTEAERMQVENITLKLQLIQESAARQSAPLRQQRDDIRMAAAKRLRISADAYDLNVDTGVFVPRNGGPANDIPQETEAADA